MREFVKNLLFTTINTVIILLFGSLVVYYFMFANSPERIEEKSVSHVIKPQGVNVLEHNQIENEIFTISGVVENTNNFSFIGVSIGVDVYMDGVRVNQCETAIHHLKENSQMPFSISCRGMEGINLPSSVTYEVEVRSSNLYGDSYNNHINSDAAKNAAQIM